MRKRLIFLLAGLTMVLVLAWTIGRRHPQLKLQEFRNTSAASDCSDSDLRTTVNRLTNDGDEGMEAAKELVSLGKQSSTCRDQIIRALVLAMDKPDLNFELDRASYFLWLNAVPVLRELKAVETLDLLIEHLDKNDGLYSGSLRHQPAMAAVTGMGAVAIPTLRVALQTHQNRNIRLAAARCLADIGGSEATDALKDALQSESDLCVRQLLKLYLVPTTPEVIRQRLVAFKCDN